MACWAWQLMGYGDAWKHPTLFKVQKCQSPSSGLLIMIIVVITDSIAIASLVVW